MTGESRLGISGALLARIRAEGRAAFVGYLPVGYPNRAGLLEAMRALVQGQDGMGADIVEIGMPYSDPMMDGPTIQYATIRALASGVRTRDVFLAVETVARSQAIPMVMIYWNLVEQYGPMALARDLANAGGAGLIIPDLTPDEADAWFEASDAHHLDRVFLIAPSSTDERIAMTMASCRGWVYATSVMGVTGSRPHTPATAPVIVNRARTTDPGLPIGVGLGISNGSQAAEVASFADAAIVGSALVRCLIDQDPNLAEGLAQIRKLSAELARGVRERSI